MQKRTRVWTLALAVAALAALPVVAAAQTYPPAGQSSGQSTTGQSNPSSQYGSTEQNSPQHHLDEAKRVLDSISTADLTGDAASRIARLKTEFNTLYTSYSNESGSAMSSSSTSGGSSTSSSSATSGQVGTSGQASMGTGWKSNFKTIERDLDSLGIPKSSYAPTATGSESSGMSGSTSGTTGSETSGTTGGATSGMSGSAMSTANVNLPSDVRDKLEQFRTHLEQFYSLTAQR